MHRYFPVFIALGLVLMTGGVMAEVPAGCGWQPGFHVDDLNGTGSEFAVYDDGTGEALYVGGDFVTAGGAIVNSIAEWDGFGWSTLSGPGGVGVDGSIYALTVYDDGTGEALYAGGSFMTAGGVTVNGIAKWDGSIWSALAGPGGTGTSGSVYALTVYDDGTGEALYAGGFFTTAGGVTTHGIAQWDGTVWSALSGPSGTGMAGADPYYVSALAVVDDGTGGALYAGGLFETAGGVIANNVAKWDGTVWSGLTGLSGGGVDARVSAIAAYDDGGGEALYAGGSFTTAGGITANAIARWDGSMWSALSGPSGPGVGGDYDWVKALEVYDDGTGAALFVGGGFSTAGGVTVNGIAKWNGTTWSDLDGGVNGAVYSLAVFDDGTGASLYAGGPFSTASGVDVWGVAKWDGSQWSALSGPSGVGMIGGGAYTLNVWDDGLGEALYAGGSFSTAGGVAVNYVAKWDGTEWSSLTGPTGTGVNGVINALAVHDDGTGAALYGGGIFESAGGVAADNVAKWDGSEWSALSGPSSNGTNDEVFALVNYDDGTGSALYAGGLFTTAGGVPSNGIGKWVCDYIVFTDGFESGDTAAWSSAQP